MGTKRKVVAAAMLISGAFAACSPGNNFRDIEGVSSQEPDSIEVFSNVDRHPNIAKICIDGVAFATTTREGNSAIMRVEAWDRGCPDSASSSSESEGDN